MARLSHVTAEKKLLDLSYTDQTIRHESEASEHRSRPSKDALEHDASLLTFRKRNHPMHEKNALEASSLVSQTHEQEHHELKVNVKMMGKRGLFLMLLGFLVFGAFILFVVLDFMRQIKNAAFHGNSRWLLSNQKIEKWNRWCVLCLILIVPVTNCFAWISPRAADAEEKEAMVVRRHIQDQVMASAVANAQVSFSRQKSTRYLAHRQLSKRTYKKHKSRAKSVPEENEQSQKFTFWSLWRRRDSSASTVNVAPKTLRKSIRQYRKKVQRNVHFVIYQVIGWLLYFICLTSVSSCDARKFSEWKNKSYPSSLKEVFCSFGNHTNFAVLAFLSEVLMVSSILVLERTRNRKQNTTRERFVLILNNYVHMLLIIGAFLLIIGSEFSRIIKNQLGQQQNFAQATQNNALKDRSIFGPRDGSALSSDIEWDAIRLTFGSFLLCVTSLFNTYGLGGFLSLKKGWKFYQPFAGGAKFIACQIISWTCFAFGLLLQVIYVISIVIVEVELFVGVTVVAGVFFLVSEILMVVSLLVFKSPQPIQIQNVTKPLNLKAKESGTMNDTSQPGQWTTVVISRLHDFAHENLQVFFVGLLANLPWIPSATYFLVFGLLAPHLKLYQIFFYSIITTCIQFLFIVFMSIPTHLKTKNQLRHDTVLCFLSQFLACCLPGIFFYYHLMYHHEPIIPIFCLSLGFYMYIITYKGRPEFFGHRIRKKWMIQKSWVFKAFSSYFNGKLIRMAPLDPKKTYVLGFHPHGVLTFSVFWLQFTEQWRTLFPDFYAHILTASVLHYVPLARDILQFLGGREVTKESFCNSLANQESVLLVPGGQAEMIESRSNQKQVRIYTRHKGFIRLAIEHGAELVPILSFKEGEIMDNINAPMLQRWFVKVLAFPFPHFPYGRWLLPVPRKVPMTIVIGEPIAVKQTSELTPEYLELIHEQYFNQIRVMFHKYKKEADCQDYELVLL